MFSQGRPTTDLNTPSGKSHDPSGSELVSHGEHSFVALE